MALMSRCRPKSQLTSLGWLAWWGLALLGMPVAWSAAMARWLAFGPVAQPYWVALAAVLVVALMALGARLARAAGPRVRSGKWLSVIAALWCLAHMVGWQCQTSILCDAGVAAGYLLTTTWIGCCAACLVGEILLKRRAKLLFVSVVSLVVGMSIIDCKGLDGSGRPIVCWRFEALMNAARASDSRQTLGPVSDRAPKPAASLASPSQPTARHDYPTFRGNGGLGTVNDEKLMTDWDASPPLLLWRRAIGKGWGGFAVVAARAYTQEQRGADEGIVCYDAASGRELWSHLDRTGFASETSGDGPRATPSVHNGRVYTLGATGLVNCLDALSGERLWSVDVLADNHAGNLYHGLSGSPLVWHDRVIVSVGGHGHSLVAYDARTGERAWRAGDDAAGYGSPLVCAFGDREQIVTLNRPGLAAHDPATGEVLWQFPWTNSAETNCSQPVPIGGDRLLVSTGYGKGCALLQIGETAEGWSGEPLWTSRNLKTKFSSPVVHGGCAFGLDDGILACVDLTDGRRRWKAGRYGHGQVLLVDDVLLVQCEDGQIVLLAADPSAHRELARLAALGDKTWNYPALAGRLLLVRNDREAACFELPAY